MEFTKTKRKLKNLTLICRADIIHYFVCFMLGRIFLLNAVSPFAIAYFGVYITKNKPLGKILFSAALSLAGIISAGFSHTVLRYMLAYVLLGLIYIPSSTIWKISRNSLAMISSFLALAVSGIIYYAQLPDLAHNLTSLTIECFLCVAFIYITKNTEENKFGKYIFPAIITMGGFCSLNIGEIAVGKSLCAVFIMIAAYCGKCTLSVTCGVGLGVLFSLCSFDFYEYVGILGFCGLVTGMASQLKRPGIVLAFLISTRLLSIYFGGWSEAVFSMAETIIAVCVFCVIPQSVLIKSKAYLCTELTNNEEFKKYTDILNAKIKTASASFETLADLSQKIIGKTPENIADISTLYDCAANRICRPCGLKFICWDREAFDTRDALNKTVNTLCQKGMITVDDIPAEFKQKCIKYESFANELNRTYFKYKTNNIWEQKIQQSQKVISMQLKGFSDIMDDFSENLHNSITFDKLEESKILYSMEQTDIKCSDVTVVKEQSGIASVTIVVRKRKGDFTQLCKTVEMVVSDALNKTMKTESYNYTTNKYFIKLREAEKFSVECSYISIPKSGETQCGDNVSHGRISHNKYTLILSDGMGCGSDAADQSTTAIELMQQFLNAGFDKSVAVEMTNSTLMLKNTETFATLDAVIVDMFTANTEFVKSGANTTYIKSKNQVTKIRSSSLPVGIINSAKAETSEYQAKDGDIIILISDGIQSADENWFEEYIKNMHEESPKMIAKLLSDEAQRQKSHNDDMTVAVLKILKNTEDIYA